MRRRFTFSALVGILLMGTVADAHAANLAKEEPVFAVTIGEPTVATTEASTACAQAESASGFAAEHPFLFSPEPSARAARPCGACSDSPCKSVPLYSACAKRVGLQTYAGQCVEPYFTDFCAEDSQWRCTCWVGPIP